MNSTSTTTLFLVTVVHMDILRMFGGANVSDCDKRNTNILNIEDVEVLRKYPSIPNAIVYVLLHISDRTTN